MEVPCSLDQVVEVVDRADVREGKCLYGEVARNNQDNCRVEVIREEPGLSALAIKSLSILTLLLYHRQRYTPSLRQGAER